MSELRYGTCPVAEVDHAGWLPAATTERDSRQRPYKETSYNELLPAQVHVILFRITNHEACSIRWRTRIRTGIHVSCHHISAQRSHVMLVSSRQCNAPGTLQTMTKRNTKHAACLPHSLIQHIYRYKCSQSRPPSYHRVWHI